MPRPHTLHTLHALASAANDSATLDELAPHAMQLTCELFGWRGAALVHWPDHDPAAGPIVLQTYGYRPSSELIAAPTDDSVSMVRNPDGNADSVIVPIVGQSAHRHAWLFRLDGADVDADQNEMLGMLAMTSSRVLERDLATQVVRASEQRFRLAFDASPLPMSLGYTGIFAEVNDALCTLLGRTRDELVGASVRNICHPDDWAKLGPAGAAALASPEGWHRVEMRMVHSAGFTLTTMVTLVWLKSADGTPQLLVQIEDITARRAVEMVLRDKAEQDGLTGLANREQLIRVLTEMGGNAEPCAVLFIDLDGFKVVNDTRGHGVGDEVLIAVANRLRDAVRPADLVARFGGDEFVIVCRSRRGSVEGQPLAQLIADRIEASLLNPIVTSVGMVHVTASVGIAEGRIDADAPQRLLQRADTAMYQAKRLGKDRHAYYDFSLHERTVERQNTEAALSTALDDNRFTVHYQPIVKLSDASIIGFEALVRLQDESGALVPPDRFIAVAEQSGLIVPMGNWVLRESCRVIAEMRELTGRPLTMSVNVAPRQVARPDLDATVMSALSEAGLPRNALSLELTESALLEANDSTLRQLTTLREKGVFIALDDFGTGYSSMTYLRNFPVSHLKVDRSFVSGMANVTSDRAIVQAVTRLARDLGMYWIAEGVETVEQRAALIELGNGLAQGYLFSRPVPAADLPALLRAQPEGNPGSRESHDRSA